MFKLNELLSIDLSQISFGALFVWLLFDTNKKNENREQKYQEIIESLSNNISLIQDVKEDVEEIKHVILGGEK